MPPCMSFDSLAYARLFLRSAFREFPADESCLLRVHSVAAPNRGFQFGFAFTELLVPPLDGFGTAPVPASIHFGATTLVVARSVLYVDDRIVARRGFLHDDPTVVAFGSHLDPTNLTWVFSLAQ